MKMALKIFIGFIVVSIVISAFFVFFGGSHILNIISNRFENLLKVSVQIKNIQVSLNRLTIDGFEIGNPRGFTLDNSFRAKSIEIHAPLTRYIKNDVKIDKINIDNVYIGLEFFSSTSSDGNWTVLIDNMERSRQQKRSRRLSKKTVLIKELILTNIETDLLYQNKGKIRHLPRISSIKLENVSSEGGDLSEQLMRTALGQMIKEVFVQENLKEMFDKIFKFPENNTPFQDMLGPFKFGPLEKIFP